LNVATGVVTVSQAGTYSIGYAVQAACAGNAPDDIAVWVAYNGTPIIGSATYTTTPSIHGGFPGSSVVGVGLFTVVATAGDTLNLQWTTLGGTTVITSYPPTTVIPQASGVIFNVQKIG
jgi:hypothetical protein